MELLLKSLPISEAAERDELRFTARRGQYFLSGCQSRSSYPELQVGEMSYAAPVLALIRTYRLGLGSKGLALVNVM